MRASVAAAWPAMCRQYEGVTTWLYLDTKGLVTTGIGFLVDSVPAAQALPWLTSAGTLAAPAEVEREWRRVKAATKWQHYSGTAAVWRDSARLHLSQKTVDDLLAKMTPRYFDGPAKACPSILDAPADAQLAILDEAWQNGPGYLNAGTAWTGTRAAVLVGDWLLAAHHVPDTGGRADRRRRLFTNAARVVKLGLDRETLWDAKTPAQRADPTPAPTPTPAPPEVPPVATVKWQHTDAFGGQRFRFWRGGNMTPTGIDVCSSIPSPVVLSQGGLSNSVPASGQTHNGLGAYDVKVAGWKRKAILTLCAELIRSGEPAFPRGGLFGSPVFSTHVHVASANNYSSLHPTAQAQVRDFKHKPRRNGLVGHGAYVGPDTPLGSWDVSPYNPKNIKEPDALQYRVAVSELQGLDVDRHPRSGKNRKAGFVIDAHKLVRRWGRWNVVTTIGTYYAVSDSSTRYLEPIIPAPTPAPVTPQEKP